MKLLKSLPLWAIIVLVLSAIAGLLTSAIIHSNKIAKPYDSVPDHIREFHHPISFIDQIKGDPKAGEKIYKGYCITCHSQTPAISLKAPRVGIKADWAPLNKLGLDRLLKLTKNGVGAMPARGGCFECSDKQLRMTIKYMLDLSK